jgi:hypothetical protein
MKPILFVLLTSILLSITTFNLSAQENPDSDKYSKIVVSLVPQYTIVGGIRLDIDKRIGNTNNYLIFSPQFYSNRNDLFWNFTYDNLTGTGMKVYHRYFMVNKPMPEGLYVQYGISYNYTRIKYTDIDWVETEFGGSSAQVESEVFFNENIHKMGGDVLLGIQYSAYENLVIDFYIGAGYRNSIYQGKRTYFESEYLSIFNPAHRGILPLGGFRIGVTF